MLLEKKPQTRKYKHFSLPPSPEPERKGHLEFLFIGKNSTIINHLIANCESGYAAESSSKAASMLARMAKHNTLPDIIVADASIGQDEIRSISSLLKEKELCSIPFFIDHTNCSPETFQFIVKEKPADDALKFSPLSAVEIKKKSEFWKKIKSANVSSTIKENRRNFGRHTEQIAKRILDIALSSGLIILFSPIFLLIYIALKIESKGPCIYVSNRAGKGYRIFKFYKFRTMVCDADQKINQLSHLNAYPLLGAPNPQFYKINNDPRVTTIGNILRRTSLDELPQLWNVLKGDMSLVGNRPLPLYEAETLTTDKWSKRFLAPAGITGLWQVNKNLNMSIEERLQLDIRYAEEMSIIKDLKIMARTPTAMIQKTNS
jgi:lipopolysaccharide/colanic/teichoic acid biosynthesis glycosyltransferase